MPRLLDDLRAAGRLHMPWYIAKKDGWKALADRLWDFLREEDLPVLLIDNVSQYYYASTDQEYWDLTRDFPNLAPPFPLFWVEHKLANFIRSEKFGETDLRDLIPRGRLGVLVGAAKPEDVKLELAPGEALPDRLKWILWCELFIDYGQQKDTVVQGPHGSIFLLVDEMGALLRPPWMQSFAGPQHAQAMRDYMSFLHPTFLAISFLHCKNVRVDDHKVDPPLAKRYHERHGITPTGYKTLVIEPLKQILRREGKSDQHGLAKAMHICRGHFADYTEGRGLFGKYHGKYWIPSTVRGTKGKEAPPREIAVKLEK